MFRFAGWARQHDACAILLGLTLSALVGLSAGCPGEQQAPDEFKVYLDRAADVWRFQGSYLVARGNTILLRGSRGYCDPSRERPITPETKFLIGSLTKPFTAICVLQQVEQAVDKKVRLYPLDLGLDLPPAR